MVVVVVRGGAVIETRWCTLGVHGAVGGDVVVTEVGGRGVNVCLFGMDKTSLG